MSTQQAVNSQQDYSTLVAALLTAVVGGVVVAAYVLAVTSVTVHKKEFNGIAAAAHVAAHRLSAISIVTPNFGVVGLCDLDEAGGQSNRVTGISTVKATIEKDGQLARALNNSLMQKLVDQDRAAFAGIEGRLKEELSMTIESGSLSKEAAAGKPSIYEDIYKLLSSKEYAPGLALVDLKFKLGHVKEHGSPARGAGLTQTQEEKPDPGFAEASDFVEGFVPGAPYAVLVEANYESQAQGGEKSTTAVFRKACALIQPAPVNDHPSCLVISFPAGLPPTFGSAMDILTFTGWKSKGQWQQVVGPEVPGQGSLAPPLEKATYNAMSPSDAFTIALYHWLRQIGPDVDEAQLKRLLASRWDASKINTEAPGASHEMERESPVNSCLMRDTGARSYSVINQTAPGGTGQAAIDHAFLCSPAVAYFKAGITRSPFWQLLSGQAFPASALPLLVDAQGNVNLAGRQGYDAKLIKDFLDAVYNTNLAALDSLSSAKLVLLRATTNINQLDQKLNQERQELVSMNNRLSRQMHDFQSKANAPHLEEQMKQSSDACEQLKSQIAEDEKREALERQVRELALQASYNSQRLAMESMDISSHAFRLCREGLFRIDNMPHAFLLGKDTIFTPATEPIADADLYSLANAKIAGTDRAPAVWLDSKFYLLNPYVKGKHTQLVVEGKPIETVIAQPLSVAVSPACAIVLDSRQVKKSAETQAQVLANYPFANIAIPRGQLVYYCADALQTGTKVGALWSCIARDLVACKAEKQEDAQKQELFTRVGSMGEPVPSPQGDWCKWASGQNLRQETCPSLAGEFQLRCPLPTAEHVPPVSFVIDPKTNEQVPEIPTLPADFL